MEVDVAKSGVHWGKYLKVRVQLDVTKKLIWGKKIAIKCGEQRWIMFKYEHLPNFCYRCGMLSHELRDCSEGKEEVLSELPTLQYGAWLRGEVSRRGGRDPIKFGIEEGWFTKGGPIRDMVGGGGRKGPTRVEEESGTRKSHGFIAATHGS